MIGDNGAGQPNHYGLGWFISSYKGHRLFLAGGNKPGFTCTYFRFVDANLTIIVLSNLSSSPLYGIAGEIAEMYLGLRLAHGYRAACTGSDPQARARRVDRPAARRRPTSRMDPSLPCRSRSSARSAARA